MSQRRGVLSAFSVRGPRPRLTWCLGLTGIALLVLLVWMAAGLALLPGAHRRLPAPSPQTLLSLRP